jgi:hypothetical protein
MSITEDFVEMRIWCIKLVLTAFDILHTSEFGPLSFMVYEVFWIQTGLIPVGSTESMFVCFVFSHMSNFSAIWRVTPLLVTELQI